MVNKRKLIWDVTRLSCRNKIIRCYLIRQRFFSFLIFVKSYFNFNCNFIKLWYFSLKFLQFSQFSRSVMSNSLRLHESQHSRLPCPSPTPRVYPDSLSHGCHPTLSSSLIPFSSCLQSFPASESFQTKSALRIRWPKYWSFTFNISPLMNTQAWSPLGWTSWISLQCKGLSRVFSNTTVQKHQFFGAQLSFLWSNSHIHAWLLEKP